MCIDHVMSHPHYIPPAHPTSTLQATSTRSVSPVLVQLIMMFFKFASVALIVLVGLPHSFAITRMEMLEQAESTLVNKLAELRAKKAIVELKYEAMKALPGVNKESVQALGSCGNCCCEYCDCLLYTSPSPRDS